MTFAGRLAVHRPRRGGGTALPSAEHHVGDMTTDHPGAETLGRRSSMPNGRAVIGGLLIAVSGIGLVVAYESANQPPGTKWLVARRPVPAGSPITTEDLGYATLGLIDEVSAHSFNAPSQLIGRIALHDLGTSELISTSDVGDRATPRASAAREVAIELERARALNGTLRRGDVVDVAATGAEPASTRVIVDGAIVISVDDGSSGGIGGTNTVRVTLAIANEEAALAVIDANEHDKVTIVIASETAFTQSNVGS